MGLSDPGQSGGRDNVASTVAAPRRVFQSFHRADPVLEGGGEAPSAGQAANVELIQKAYNFRQLCMGAA